MIVIMTLESYYVPISGHCDSRVVNFDRRGFIRMATGAHLTKLEGKYVLKFRFREWLDPVVAILINTMIEIYNSREVVTSRFAYITTPQS